jgi:hypothetical protein
MDDSYLVALAADWGSGTDSAYRVGRLIAGHRPDCTIHLGDVYYSGTEREFRDYFLPADAWPRGAQRTFALNGNHEMYSGGEGYFGVALPALDQEASYFCLENAHWRVVALDTGYYAKTFPFLELFDTNLIKLHRAMRAWLADVVFRDPADKRPVVLLTHHNWFSAFDSEYRRAASDTAACRSSWARRPGANAVWCSRTSGWTPGPRPRLARRTSWGTAASPCSGSTPGRSPSGTSTTPGRAAGGALDGRPGRHGARLGVGRRGPDALPAAGGAGVLTVRCARRQAAGRVVRAQTA